MIKFAPALGTEPSGSAPVAFKPEQHFKGTNTEGTARYTEKDQPVGCASRTDCRCLRCIECTLPIPLINFRSQFNFFWYNNCLAKKPINLLSGFLSPSIKD
ncbi:hypothetical protein CXF72_06395 [Psychromonas sp. MB-3u-54]|nr:hypothetical protein CXF72_06395 [Psychromonas sp. MB-3u-54]